MNEFEAGYLLGRISRATENPDITPSIMKEFNDLKMEIIKLMDDKKKK